MNKTGKYIFLTLLTALMVAACSLEGDIDEVLSKAGIEKPGNSNGMSVPSGLTAYAESSSSISIYWHYYSDSDIWFNYFNVYRSSSAYGSYSYIGMAYTTAYTDTGLAANTTYYYKVATVNTSYGESSQSSYTSATTYSSSSGSGAPNAPTGVTAQTWSSNSIYISWYWVSGADVYYVYRGSSPSDSFSYIGMTYDGAYTDTDTGLSSNTTYYYKVIAHNDYGDSPYSEYTWATTGSY